MSYRETKRRIAILAAIILPFLVLYAWQLGFIPSYGEICHKNEYTGDKECATYNTALILLWHLSEGLNYYGVAITAIATGAIGWFTYTLSQETQRLRRLAVRQARDTTISLRISRDAANAATLSANAAIGIELPILRAIPVDMIHLDAPIPQNAPYCGCGGDSYVSKYMGIGYIPIKNLGRTNAIPISYAVGWQIAEVLPAHPIYTESGGFNHAEVIKPDGGCEIDAHFTIEISDSERDGITKDIIWLWFYGSIKYFDFMNTQREARFCWRLANRNPRRQTLFFHFESDGNPPEAYIKADCKNVAT